MKTPIILVLLVLVSSSCSSLKRTYSISKKTLNKDANIGRYYVEKIEIITTANLDNDGKRDFLDFKNQLEQQVRISNKKVLAPIKAKTQIIIEQLKVKGSFARMNRALGGSDVIQGKVILKNKNDKFIKSYDVNFKHSFVATRKLLFETVSKFFMSDVYKYEK